MRKYDTMVDTMDSHDPNACSGFKMCAGRNYDETKEDCAECERDMLMAIEALNIGIGDY